jgi:hypothetical protein
MVVESPDMGFCSDGRDNIRFLGIKHALYGKQHAPGASLHIRFGKDSNAPKEKPKAGEPHP